MQITMKRDKLGAGGTLLAKDSTVDVDEALARTLVGEGSAVFVTEPADPDFRPDGGGGGVVAVSSSRALTSADNGKVLRCSTSVTLEYPEGLGDSFSCIVEPPSSGTVTLDPTGSCTLNGATANLTRTRSNNPAGFVIRALSADVAGVSGS